MPRSRREFFAADASDLRTASLASSMVLYRWLRAALAAARFSKPHLLAAVSLFAIEVVIALFVHDQWVRPLLGDTLAIVLLYAMLKSVWPLPRTATALALLALCCALEVAQYFRIVELLGLQGVAAARVIIGTSYDPLDFVAYAAGAGLIVLSGRRCG